MNIFHHKTLLRILSIARRHFDMVPLLFLTFIFLLEGLSLLSVRSTQLLLMYVPLLYLLTATNIALRVPRNALWLGLLFVGAGVLLLPFSVIIDESFEHLLTYIAIFLVSIMVYNHRTKQTPHHLSYFIIFVTMIFSLASWIQLTGRSPIPVPTTGEQFIYTTFGHNNLGHLATVSILACIYLFFTSQKSRYLIPLLIVVPSLFLSISRTAFISLSIGLLFLIWTRRTIREKPHRHVLLAGVVLVLVTLAAAGGLPGKDSFGNRPLYWQTAVSAFFERPLTGWGGNGYRYAFMDKVPAVDLSSSAHNIFLDALVEYGITGIFFIGLLVLIIAYTARPHLAFLCITIPLFISFQLDFVYRIPVLLLFFFMAAFSVYKEKREITVGKTPLLVISILLAFFSFQILLSGLFYAKNQPRIAFAVYPLNVSASESLTHPTGTIWHEFIVRNNPEAQFFLAGRAQGMGDHEKALGHYEKILSLQRYVPMREFAVIYDFVKSYKGQGQADWLAEQYLETYSGLPEVSAFDPQLTEQLEAFCREHGYSCPEFPDN